MKSRGDDNGRKDGSMRSFGTEEPAVQWSASMWYAISYAVVCIGDYRMRLHCWIHWGAFVECERGREMRWSV
jgi:hypothetical protein